MESPSRAPFVRSEALLWCHKLVPEKASPFLIRCLSLSSWKDINSLVGSTLHHKKRTSWPSMKLSCKSNFWMKILTGPVTRQLSLTLHSLQAVCHSPHISLTYQVTSSLRLTRTLVLQHGQTLTMRSNSCFFLRDSLDSLWFLIMWFGTTTLLVWE